MVILYPPISRVPHEILHEIFRIATEVPEPLVCFMQDCHHESRRNTSNPPYIHYKDSLVMKLSLCSVSRLWNEAATPLLYQRVWITSLRGNHRSRRRQTRRLIRTLNSSPVPDSPPTRNNLSTGWIRSRTHTPFGAFVQRFEFTCPRGGEGSQFAEENISHSLAQLLRLMSNLRILAIRTSGNVSPLEPLQALSPRLEHLHWTTVSSRRPQECKITIPSLLEVLESHPILQTVNLVYDLEKIDSGSNLAQQWGGKVFPSISHWALAMNQTNMLPMIPLAAFPNLQVVTYFRNARVYDSLPYFVRFLSAYGAQLEAIHIQPREQLEGTLKAIVRWCPRLREVHLRDPHKWATPPTIKRVSAIGTGMPRMTTLSLELCHREPGDRRMGWEGAITLQWKDIFPNLRTIQLLDIRDVKALTKMTEKVREVVSHCHDYGVDLLDDVGQTITPVSPAGPVLAEAGGMAHPSET